MKQPMRRHSSVIRIYVTVGRRKLSVYIVADGHFHMSEGNFNINGRLQPSPVLVPDC